MRATNNDYNSPESLHDRKLKYLGREVRDTYNRVGTVTFARPTSAGIIVLLVVSADGNHSWLTDNEHATLTGRHTPQTDYVPSAGNRGELDES